MANGVSRAVIEVLRDRMHQGAATVAPDGRLTYGNQRLASMLDQSRAQLVGRPLLGHGQASCLVTDLTEGKHVSVLAHEVRNMLGTIRNSVELLKRSSIDADGQRALESIERHSGRILELMEDLRRVNPKE